MAINEQKRKIEVPPSDPFYFEDNEKLWYKWSNIFWVCMFIGHHVEKDSIPYWTLFSIGAISTIVAFYYLYKWFRE